MCANKNKKSGLLFSVMIRIICKTITNYYFWGFCSFFFSLIFDCTDSVIAYMCSCKVHSFTGTPSSPWCHLKTTNKSVKFKTCEHFCLLFHTGTWKDFHHDTALKVDVLQDWTMYCLQASLWIFQCRNVTGWGSEGVNNPFLLSPLQPLHPSYSPPPPPPLPTLNHPFSPCKM